MSSDFKESVEGAGAAVDGARTREATCPTSSEKVEAAFTHIGLVLQAASPSAANRVAGANAKTHAFNYLDFLRDEFKLHMTAERYSDDETLVELVARALYNRAMEERGSEEWARWEGPETEQRTPFRGAFRDGWRSEARRVLNVEAGPMTDDGTQSQPRYVSDGDQWAKLACGCYAEWDGYEWIVAASAFLCDHKQGDHADGAPPEGETTA